MHAQLERLGLTSRWHDVVVMLAEFATFPASHANNGLAASGTALCEAFRDTSGSGVDSESGEGGIRTPDTSLN